MDTISHTLWGRGLFGYGARPWMAAFFGAFPDLASFGLFFILRLIEGNFQLGPPSLESIPGWVFTCYDWSHSFVSAFVVIGVVSYFKKEFAFAMLGWPFHILLDFPFHSIEYFPTKLFYPLTDFTFDGIPWSRPEIWFPNLAGLFILFYWRRKRKSFR